MPDYYGKYGFREQVKTEQIVDVLMKEFPNRWKDINSCSNHVRGVISRELKIIPMNDHKPLVYARVDALRIIEHIGTHWQRRKNIGQISMQFPAEKMDRRHININDCSINITEKTSKGNDAIKILDEEVARTGKPMSALVADMIIEYRANHPIQLTEEDKLRIEVKKLKEQIRQLQKGDNT
jgi:hypothetical protein